MFFVCVLKKKLERIRKIIKVTKPKRKMKIDGFFTILIGLSFTFSVSLHFRCIHFRIRLFLTVYYFKIFRFIFCVQFLKEKQLGLKKIFIGN